MATSPELRSTSTRSRAGRSSSSDSSKQVPHSSSNEAGCPSGTRLRCIMSDIRQRVGRWRQHVLGRKVRRRWPTSLRSGSSPASSTRSSPSDTRSSTARFGSSTSPTAKSSCAEHLGATSICGHSSTPTSCPPVRLPSSGSSQDYSPQGRSAASWPSSSNASPTDHCVGATPRH